MPDTALPGLFPQAPPPARPVATPEDRAALLAWLQDRRHQMVDDFAAEFVLDGPPPLSALQPISVVQAAILTIKAVQAELAKDRILE